MAPSKGVIEGFDWPEQAAVDAAWGEFRPEDRMYLVAALHTWGYDTYLYDPRALRGRNADPVALMREPAHWPDTFDVARDHGVEFVWALDPSAHSKGLMDGVERLVDLGVAGVVLLFEGRGGDPEKRARAHGHIARNIEARFPGVLKACRTDSWRASGEAAQRDFVLLDEELPESVALVWSGGTDPDGLNTGELPTLDRRGTWIWDEALANDGFEAGAPRLQPLSGRGVEELKSHDGWLLELPRTLDLALPAVAGCGVTANGDGDASGEAMARAWVRWFHDVDEDAVRTLLRVASGAVGPEELTEHRQVALRAKPALNSVLTQLVGRPPELR